MRNLPQVQQVPDASSLAVIAIGCNLPAQGSTAISYVAESSVALVASIGKLYLSSKYYRTPAFPAGSDPDFVNAVVAVETDLSPAEILAHLHAVEEDFGRERTVRWGARSLDLDLICMGARVLPNATTQTEWRNLTLADQMTKAPTELILPHPRLQDRSFVLVPMAEILPDWRHPLLGLTTAQMRDARPEAERAEIWALWSRI